MPRDKDTGARKGFAFLMYEDQRSTILAVDNLNGAKVLEKTLRVDHVKNYTQPKVRNEDGELVEAEEQSFNAKPQMIDDDAADSDSSASSGATIDPEDPMRDYLIAQRKEKKALKKARKSRGKGKHQGETPEERKARKAKNKERKAKKAKSAGMKGVEDLLNSLGRRDIDIPRSDSRAERTRKRSPEPSRRSRSRSRSPRRRSWSRSRHSPYSDERHPHKQSRHLDDDDNRSYGHHLRGRSSRD